MQCEIILVWPDSRSPEPTHVPTRLRNLAVGRMDERVFIFSSVACAVANVATVQAAETHTYSGQPVFGGLYRHRLGQLYK